MPEPDAARSARIETDVAIIGGGLSGLAVADSLHRAGLDVRLFEARERFGGRIDILRSRGGAVDLGPSWFWPGQPRIAELIDTLGLHAFPQYARGDLTFEEQTGEIRRGVGFASMEGSFRLQGGMQGLIDGLVARLPGERLHLQRPVTGVGPDGTVTLADGGTCRAAHVVLALPPRLMARLHFTPALPDAALRSLAGIPTWMAGHAKLVAVYDRPFWRDTGLSGDAMSHRGPLMEIHDASGPNGSPAALFGFLGVPASQRAGRGPEIAEAARKQLGRLFGPDARAPVEIVLKDWATEPETATLADHIPPQGHPTYGMPRSLAEGGSDRLHIAGTESDASMGGLMEGALAAAERVSRSILGGARQTSRAL